MPMKKLNHEVYLAFLLFYAAFSGMEMNCRANLVISHFWLAGSNL